MDIQEIIDNIDKKLLKEAYNLHLKGKPYYFLPENGQVLGKYIDNSLKAQELVDYNLAVPISNVGTMAFNGPLSFSLTPLGIEIVEEYL